MKDIASKFPLYHFWYNGYLILLVEQYLIVNKMKHDSVDIHYTSISQIDKEEKQVLQRSRSTSKSSPLMFWGWFFIIVSPIVLILGCGNLVFHVYNMFTPMWKYKEHYFEPLHFILLLILDLTIIGVGVSGLLSTGLKKNKKLRLRFAAGVSDDLKEW